MDERSVSRRQAVGLVGLGLASAAAGVAMAQQETPAAATYRNGAVAKDHPLGQPADLASIYVQLAASDASFTRGNIYGADGGQRQP